MGKESAPRSFAVFLTNVRDGDLHAECSDELRDLIDDMQTAASTQGKARGSLTLTLNFDLDSRGVVEVKSEVKVKAPKLEHGKAVFWLDEEGHLCTENPRQQKLPIRDVSAPTAARDVNPAPAEARSV